MTEKGWKVFALFSDGIQWRDLPEAIKRLRSLELGAVWPLSMKYPTAGVLITEVKDDSLERVLSELRKLEFIKLADALPRRVDPSERRSSCGLKKDK